VPSKSPSAFSQRASERAAADGGAIPNAEGEEADAFLPNTKGTAFAVPFVLVGDGAARSGGKPCGENLTLELKKRAPQGYARGLKCSLRLEWVGIFMNNF